MHIFMPALQQEFDFGHIDDYLDNFTEVTNMLKHNIEGWRQNYIGKGRQQGLEQGLEQSRRKAVATLAQLLTKRFGDISIEQLRRIESASSDELEQWTLAILDVESVDQLLGEI